MDKRSLNTLQVSSVSNLIVTFFNGISIGDYGNKCQRYLGTKEKEFNGKVGHTCKIQRNLCTLSLPLPIIHIENIMTQTSEHTSGSKEI